MCIIFFYYFFAFFGFCARSIVDEPPLFLRTSTVRAVCDSWVKDTPRKLLQYPKYHVSARPTPRTGSNATCHESRHFIRRSWTVIESKVRGLRFHFLCQRPFFVIVEANAGSRKFENVTNTHKRPRKRPVFLSIEPQHYAFKPGFWCELTSVYYSPTSSIKI